VRTLDVYKLLSRNETVYRCWASNKIAAKIVPTQELVTLADILTKALIPTRLTLFSDGLMVAVRGGDRLPRGAHRLG
jgi:hypothetical protein